MSDENTTDYYVIPAKAGIYLTFTITLLLPLEFFFKSAKGQLSDSCEARKFIAEFKKRHGKRNYRSQSLDILVLR